MGQEVATLPAFKLPNRDALAKNSGKLLKLLLLGGIGVGVYILLLPFLLSLVVGSIEFIGACIVLIFLGAIIVNPKFWRGLNYMTQFISEKFLGIWITLDPWLIMLNEIAVRASDREKSRDIINKLRGHQSVIADKVESREKDLELAADKIQVLQSKYTKATTQDQKDDILLDIQTPTTAMNNAKSYIDGVKPMLKNMTDIIIFGDKEYKRSGIVLDNLRSTIETEKDKWETVSLGSVALNSAKSALIGRPELHEDSMKALEYVRKDMGDKLGQMVGDMQIASQFMNDADLTDAAKLKQAADTIGKLNSGTNFNYAESVEVRPDQDITKGINVSSKNEYIDIFNK